MSLLKSLTVFFLEFLETAVMALLIFAIMYVFLFQPHQVKGNSMLPNFFNGEYLLTNKLTYRFNDPQRGDVIIFRSPEDPRYDYIKRIIGLPGDKIKISKGSFYVNDQKINESTYLPPTTRTNSGYSLKEGQEITILEDYYFVAGDNRTNSSDSRDFGPIPIQSIVGKAWFMYWPPAKIGLIQQKSYSF